MVQLSAHIAEQLRQPVRALYRRPRDGSEFEVRIRHLATEAQTAEVETLDGRHRGRVPFSRLYLAEAPATNEMERALAWIAGLQQKRGVGAR